MITMDKEIWRPISGYEGIYEVSNYGQVRSLDRLVQRSNGQIASVPGRILKQSRTKETSEFNVCLAKESKNLVVNVSKLVYMTFFEDFDEYDIIRHVDNNISNNRADNLYIEVIEDIEGEEWKPVPNYEDLYAVSNKGRVKACRHSEEYIRPDTGVKCVRTRKERLLVLNNRDGYQSIGLVRKGETKYFFVHRLVAISFGVPNPENKPQINHKDGNPSNNCVENLEWCTAKENVQDYIEKRGRKNLTNLIKEKYGKKVVCLDTMKTYVSAHDAEVDLGFSYSSILSSIKNRSCCYGFTFVMKEDYDDPDFDANKYMFETKNRYSKWTRSEPFLRFAESESKIVDTTSDKKPKKFF